MEAEFKSHERKGGGYLQREKKEKMRKLEGKRQSGLAELMVLNFTTSTCPTPKNKAMSLLNSLRPLGFLRLGALVPYGFEGFYKTKRNQMI